MGLLKFCKNCSKNYKHVEKFEKKFANFVGAKHCIAVNSGYSALFLALKAHGIGKGDEVIVPDFTMVATANAVKECGATPVFVDVTINGNIDTHQIKVTKRTKAIIPVHIYGHPANMDEIERIAKEHDLAVIEDAAEAHGAEYQGRKIGSKNTSCFSFYSNKIIETGEGGAVCTDDDYIAEQVRSLRSYCFDESYWHKGLGYSFRMNPYGAKHGTRQLRFAQYLLWRRRATYRLYRRFTDLEYQFTKHDVKHVYWMIAIFPPTGLRRHLNNKGVETREFFVPMTAQPMYKQEVSPKAWELYLEGLLLPTKINIIKQLKVIYYIRQHEKQARGKNRKR